MKYGWNYLPIVLSVLGIFLTFIKFISYLRQVYVVYLFGLRAQPSIELKKEHIVMLFGLSLSQMLVVILLAMALSYSMAPLEFGSIKGAIKLVILLICTWALFACIILVSESFQRIAESIVGVERIYVIEEEFFGEN